MPQGVRRQRERPASAARLPLRAPPMCPHAALQRVRARSKAPSARRRSRRGALQAARPHQLGRCKETALRGSRQVGHTGGGEAASAPVKCRKASGAMLKSPAWARRRALGPRPRRRIRIGGIGRQAYWASSPRQRPPFQTCSQWSRTLDATSRARATQAMRRRRHVPGRRQKWTGAGGATPLPPPRRDVHADTAPRARGRRAPPPPLRDDDVGGVTEGITWGRGFACGRSGRGVFMAPSRREPRVESNIIT